ncbi:MAG: hypothetical protein KDN20_04505 [Verrucomicrobiae bacterium]|nr:hypothetical protein [Verrucomicrobiae bacterium]
MSAEPITWDSGLRWDTPGLKWDGTVPDPPSNPPPPMTDTNRISAELTQQQVDDISAAIQTIRDNLDFLISLSAQDRREMPKLGDKTLAFDEKCASHMAAHPELVPGFVDTAEVAKDRALRIPLANVERLLTELCDAVSDTLLQVGSEIYMADLSFYASVRDAARRNIPAADVIYAELQERFPGRPSGSGGDPGGGAEA